MYKCDKCGCEHTSRTTCPKCGAPVIVVNQDYLLRRAEWEAKQKENLKWKTKEERDRLEASEKSNKNRTDRYYNKNMAKNSTGKNSTGKKPKNKNRKNIGSYIDDALSRIMDENAAASEAKDINFIYNMKLLFEEIAEGISTAFHKKKRKIKEEQERKKRHKGIDTTVVLETDEEKASMEKLMLDHVYFKDNRLRNVLVGFTIIAVLIFAAMFSFNVISNAGKDIVYFDGNKIISVKKGEQLDLSSIGENCTIIGYSENMNAALLKQDGGYIGWYNGKTVNLESNYGEMTTEYMFSDNGKYVSYVMYDSSSEIYNLILCNMKNGNMAVYPGNSVIDLIEVTESGKVIYLVMETTGYALVIDSVLWIADMKADYIIHEAVQQAGYSAADNKVLFMVEDSLYISDISDKVLKKAESAIPSSAYKIIDDEVTQLVENFLEDSILYMKADKLYAYDAKKQSSKLIAKGIDSFADIFYSEKEKFLYYKVMDSLYSCNLSTQEKAVVIHNISGNVEIREKENVIMCMDEDHRVWKCGKKVKEWYKNDDIVSVEQFVEYKNRIYFVDKNNILWKVTKNLKKREQIGEVIWFKYIEK